MQLDYSETLAEHQGDQLKNTIFEVLKEKKALQITEVDLKKIPNVLAKYFVVCEGTSQRHIEALSDYLQEFIELTLDMKPSRVDGYGSAWILLDYFDIIIHLFLPQERQRYNLEGLWSQGEIRHIENDTNIKS